ncbi:DNA primase large subunit PriL [Methanobacterium alcaliphilum]|uniref:DNA primase large subunit PriL n=1 Tax=Methanobacterium alcaliphilum TaxID=392018 RepID=UPI00200A7E7C|nr:DNA primase large subunit PriL [Methanobacterium alcaliphilum]MCK9152489.1 DNA primase large subunit PriL [Methanobacterium alcaliphilum]
MVSLSFLNPLSSEGEEIVREKGSLDHISDINAELLMVVRESESQKISNDSYIPQSYADLAVKRVEWYARKKNDKKYNHNDYAFLLNPEITEFDVISFYIAAQSVGIKFKPNSRETRLMIEAQGKLVEERLEKIPSYQRKEIVDNLLNQLVFEDNIPWTSIAELLGSKKIRLADLILDQGEVILEKDDFMDRFDEKIIGRPSEKMYDLLIGERIKIMIITRMIMQNTENYIKRVHDMASKIEPHPSLLQIADQITEKINESISYYSSSGGGFGGDIKASELVHEAFPPCIQKTIEGVGSGNRNDAIVLLLTSFISYARLYPSVFRNDISMKISDIDADLQITINEILPLIYDAADRCTPPLFEDDPQEKLNITAKLGFGVHTIPELKNEGESKWYTPMSCEKIKIHLSSLCKPDATCKNIGNPLSYYNRKRWELRKSGGKSKTNEDTKNDE